MVRTNTQSEVEAWYYGKYYVVVQYAATCVLYAVRFFFIISRIFVSFFICLYLLLAVVRCAEPFNRALKLHEFQASAFLKGTQDKSENKVQQKQERLIFWTYLKARASESKFHFLIIIFGLTNWIFALYQTNEVAYAWKTVFKGSFSSFCLSF